MNSNFISNIIGAGPAGLCCAVNLANRGLPFRIFDQTDGATSESRATGLQSETVSLFEKLGLGEQLRAMSTLIYGSQIYFNQAPVDTINFSDPYNNFAVNQSDLEILLVNELKSRWGVEIIRNTPISIVNNKLTLPESECRDEKSLKLLAWGNQPEKQKQLGFSSITERTNEVSFACRAEIDSSIDHKFMHQFASNAGRTVIVPLPNENEFKITGYFGHSVTPLETPSRHALIRLIFERTGIHICNVSEVYLYRLNQNQAHDLSLENLFLVGDSAQRLLPDGGFGLNTAIQQAFHLTDLIGSSTHLDQIKLDYNSRWIDEVQRRVDISRSLNNRVSPEFLKKSGEPPQFTI